MRRQLIAAVATVAVVLVLFPTAPARADTQPVQRCYQDDWGETVCQIVEVDVPDGGDHDQPRRRRRPAPPPVPVPDPADVLYWPRIIRLIDGSPCITWREEVFPGAASSGKADQAEMQMLRYLRAGYRFCPGAPPAPVRARPTPPPPVMAQEVIEILPMPVPAPDIAPGFAVVGKLAYLETRSNLRPPRITRETPLGTIVADPVGTYVVDWGDGTVQRYDHEGGAYPEGTITHSYQRAGIFRVVVTAEWSVPWTIGPTTGTVQGITTQAAIDNFEVRQLQPVRNT